MKIDVPLDEKQLIDVKIFLNTFKPKALLIEKEEMVLPSESINYDKVLLNSPTEFISDYISGLRVEEVQKTRILEKVRGILDS